MIVKMLVVIGIILQLATGVTTVCEWVAVKHNVYIPHKLAEVALQVATNSRAGSDEYVYVGFYNLQGELAGAIWLYFSSPPKYSIDLCMGYVNLPAHLPTQQEKVWRITRTGYRLVITCNGVQVVDILVSDSTCSDSNWEVVWGRDVEQIEFTSGGTAEDYYIASNNYCAYPVDGVWSDWGAWGSCDAACGGGSQGRTRTCSNPPASGGGADCSGSASDTQACNKEACPVDGEFGEWGEWTTCSLECGGGTQSRTRACDNPEPANGGASCVGDAEQSRNCNDQACPVGVPVKLVAVVVSVVLLIVGVITLILVMYVRSRRHPRPIDRETLFSMQYQIHIARREAAAQRQPQNDTAARSGSETETAL